MSDYELLVKRGICMPVAHYAITFEYVQAMNQWAEKAFAAIRADEREKAAQIAERHANHYPSNVWLPFKAEDKDVSRDRVSAAMGRQMSHIIANAIRAAARGDGAREVLIHADNCDPAYGCTCGTRTLIIRQGGAE